MPNEEETSEINAKPSLVSRKRRHHSQKRPEIVLADTDSQRAQQVEVARSLIAASPDDDRAGEEMVVVNPPFIELPPDALERLHAAVNLRSANAANSASIWAQTVLFLHDIVA